MGYSGLYGIVGSGSRGVRFSELLTQEYWKSAHKMDDGYPCA